MKKLLLSGFLAFLFLFPNLAVGGEKPLIITLRIDKTTTQEDLTRQIEFMKANGYDFSIEYLRFDENGGVEAICAKVKFDKWSGSFETRDIEDGNIVVKKNLLGQGGIYMNGKP